MLSTIRLSSKARALLASVAVLATSTACGEKKSAADAKDLVADRNGKNIALIFGASNGLEGVATDLAELEKLFKSSDYNLGFEAHVVPEATEAMILSESAKWAKEVGNNGTLFWYFSGHGAESGTIYTADQNLLGWRDIAKAIKKARSTPLKRLMVLEDSCFSGAIVDGQQSISNSYSAAAAKKQADAAAGNIKAAFAAENAPSGAYDAATLYEQIMILSASRKTETSADAGAGQGGGFTYSFRTVLKSLKAKPDAKIRDFITETQDETAANFQHTPQYRAEPEALVLDDFLWKRPGGAVGATGGTLMLALGADLGGDKFTAAIAAPQGTAKVGLCVGAKLACTDAKKVDLVFGAGAARGDHLVFRSTGNIALTDGATLTLLAFKADGSIADAVTVQSKKH